MYGKLWWRECSLRGHELYSSDSSSFGGCHRKIFSPAAVRRHCLEGWEAKEWTWTVQICKTLEYELLVYIFDAGRMLNPSQQFCLHQVPEIYMAILWSADHLIVRIQNARFDPEIRIPVASVKNFSLPSCPPLTLQAFGHCIFQRGGLCRPCLPQEGIAVRENWFVFSF